MAEPDEFDYATVSPCCNSPDLCLFGNSLQCNNCNANTCLHELSEDEYEYEDPGIAHVEEKNVGQPIPPSITSAQKGEPHESYEYKAFKAPDEFRVIVLHAAEGFHEDIRCDLEHHLLSEPPKYEAVSYTWANEDGNDERSEMVYIGNTSRTIHVTQNCMSALRTLRLEGKWYQTRRIWIDMMCIDQNEAQERSHQVGLMGKIYSQASGVLVYLGPEGNDYDDLLHHLVSSFWNPQLLMSPERLDEKITHFYQRRWFNRVWVLQEIALARQATVIWGRKSILWTVLLDRLKSFHRSKVDVPGALKFDLGSYLRKSSLLSLLHAARPCQASNPRDKVFALLGLTTDHESELEVDYASNETTIYQRTAVHIIRINSSLDVLSLVEHERRLLDLPSWVPDWNICQDIVPLIEIPLQKDETRKMVHYPQFHNSGTLPQPDLKPEITEHFTLLLSGNCIDTVTFVAGKSEDQNTSRGLQAYVNRVGKVKAALNGILFLALRTESLLLCPSDKEEKQFVKAIHHAGGLIEAIGMEWYWTEEYEGRLELRYEKQDLMRSIDAISPDHLPFLAVLWKGLEALGGVHDQLRSDIQAMVDNDVSTEISESISRFCNVRRDLILQHQKNFGEALRLAWDCYTGGIQTGSTIKTAQGIAELSYQLFQGQIRLAGRLKNVLLATGQYRAVEQMEEAQDSVSVFSPWDSTRMGIEGYEQGVEFIYYRNSEQYSQQLQHYGQGRKIFETKGSLGFGPRDIQPGDEIWYLHYAKVPLVLRRVNEHYRLVGECYLQGAMQDQFFDSQDGSDLGTFHEYYRKKIRGGPTKIEIV